MSFFYVYLPGFTEKYTAGAFHRGLHRGMIAGSFYARQRSSIRFREMDARIKIARYMYAAQLRVLIQCVALV